jgi:hypothetical protein
LRVSSLGGMVALLRYQIKWKEKVW